MLELKRMLTKALNHMTCPSMPHDEFMRKAKEIGCVGVHYRNDLERPLFEGRSPESVAELAQGMGMKITGLAQLSQFNKWNAEREAEAKELIDIAVRIGAAGIGLIPLCDGTGTADGDRQQKLKEALLHLKPMLEEAGIQGFIEPLGFAHCSLRHKSEAVDAIISVHGEACFRLVHDTFHHFLANERATGAAIFPEFTGIVEISGVVDSSLLPSQMRDEHRVLVDENDVIGNVAQIKELMLAGYNGPVSFEPFSPLVHTLQNPAKEIAKSFDFISEQLGA